MVRLHFLPLFAVCCVLHEWKVTWEYGSCNKWRQQEFKRKIGRVYLRQDMCKIWGRNSFESKFFIHHLTWSQKWCVKTTTCRSNFTSWYKSKPRFWKNNILWDMWIEQWDFIFLVNYNYCKENSSLECFIVDDASWKVKPKFCKFIFCNSQLNSSQSILRANGFSYANTRNQLLAG